MTVGPLGSLNKEEEFGLELKDERNENVFDDVEVNEMEEDDIQNRIWEQFVRPRAGSVRNSLSKSGKVKGDRKDSTSVFVKSVNQKFVPLLAMQSVGDEPTNHSDMTKSATGFSDISS